MGWCVNYTHCCLCQDVLAVATPTSCPSFVTDHSIRRRGFRPPCGKWRRASERLRPSPRCFGFESSRDSLSLLFPSQSREEVRGEAGRGCQGQERLHRRRRCGRIRSRHLVPLLHLDRRPGPTSSLSQTYTAEDLLLLLHFASAAPASLSVGELPSLPGSTGVLPPSPSLVRLLKPIRLTSWPRPCHHPSDREVNLEVHHRGKGRVHVTVWFGESHRRWRWTKTSDCAIAGGRRRPRGRRKKKEEEGGGREPKDSPGRSPSAACDWPTAPSASNAWMRSTTWKRSRENSAKKTETERCGSCRTRIAKHSGRHIENTSSSSSTCTRTNTKTSRPSSKTRWPIPCSRASSPEISSAGEVMCAQPKPTR